jgi:4-hydroxy-3-methylbut-2-en-1-yl diphosphate reductase
VDVVIVVGSPTSSNSNRLRELAERLGTPAYMVDAPTDLQPEWFEGRRRVGLTAGASAPDILVQQVIARLRELGASASGDGRRAGGRALPAAARPGRPQHGEGGFAI